MENISIAQLCTQVSNSNIEKRYKDKLLNMLERTPDSNDFGNRLRELRIQKGFHTCGDLAKAIGVNRATVGKWETGDRKPDIDMIVILCSFLGVTPNDLLCT